MRRLRIFGAAWMCFLSLMTVVQGIVAFMDGDFTRSTANLAYSLAAAAWVMLIVIKSDP